MAWRQLGTKPWAKPMMMGILVDNMLKSLFNFTDTHDQISPMLWKPWLGDGLVPAGHQAMG